MGGDELRLNHVPEFTAHRKIEIKANIADTGVPVLRNRKELQAQHQRGEIFQVVFDREYDALIKNYNRLNDLLGVLGQAGESVGKASL
jgi:hypothetical protein